MILLNKFILRSEPELISGKDYMVIKCGIMRVTAFNNYFLFTIQTKKKIMDFEFERHHMRCNISDEWGAIIKIDDIYGHPTMVDYSYFRCRNGKRCYYGNYIKSMPRNIADRFIWLVPIVAMLFIKFL